MKTIKILPVALLILATCFLISCKDNTKKNEAEMNATKSKYKYESIPNDPMNTKIYTLDNGLKIYMSVYRNEPRIQTYIATRAGSKNDPADATGLAHYLEHMLFKGTSKIGALDWEKEKALLQQISDLYEEHFKANPKQRKEIYKKIDKISNEAAKLVAVNEYDKMISSMGAKGTNAFTSLDQTVYVNDIPANELERWLKVESERFNQLVLRLFHTELEAVYEEYNISQSSDGSKVFRAFMEGLLPNHPYGTQSTIGTSEHLKRPSMVKINEFFETYYVPNNMAIILAGDFNPDDAVDLVKKYFGDYKPKDVPEFEIPEQPEIKKPVVKEVVGTQKALIDMGWRLPGAGTDEALMAEIVANILSNGKAGLVDINLLQKQKIGSNSTAFAWSAKDFSFLGFYAYPKPGQKLEEVKGLFLEQLEKVRKGEFEDWMLEAVVTNLDYNFQKSLESNRGRADKMMNAFVREVDWAREVSRFRRMRTVTKAQITEFAKKYLKDDNFVIVYKREGDDKDVVQVKKPKITKVSPPEDVASPFREAFVNMDPADPKPQFIDFKEKIKSKSLKSGVQFDYIKNPYNKTFRLSYILDMGSEQDKILPMAVRYLKYLGTDKYTPEELQKEFYKLGLSFDVYAGAETSYITLKGLDRSLEKGVKLFEHILANAQPNEAALKNLIAQTKKDRLDAKKDKRQVLQNAMFNYARYGKNSPFRSKLSFSEMDALLPQQLINKINDLTRYKHDVFYYGTTSIEEVKAILDEYHQVPEVLMDYPPRPDYKEQENKKTKVVFVPFPDMAQAEIMMVSKGTEGFDLDQNIKSQLYNEYFGYGLSSVVFREIREKRALAYSSYAYSSAPSNARDAHYFRAYVGTQADKLKQAIPAMREIIEDIPLSEEQITNAVEAIKVKTATDRLTGDNIYWTYRRNKKRGYEKDLRKETYDFFTSLNMESNKPIDVVKNFHEKHIKDRNYTILVLGEKGKIDTKYLKSLGDYEQKSVDEVFGY